MVAATSRDDPYSHRRAKAVNDVLRAEPLARADRSARASGDVGALLPSAFDGLATDLMRIFAMALDLPSHFFDGVLDKSIGALRGLNYPWSSA